jgi:HD-GYP domain-containing protein (c-di-GMP phosphodiesterase class II)
VSGPEKVTREDGAGRRNPFGRTSFRFLAVLAAAGTVVATTVVLTAANERHLRTIIEQETESSLLLEARNLAVVSADALLGEFPELTLVPLVRDLEASRPDLKRIVILGGAGMIRGGPEPREIGEPFLPDGEEQELESHLSLAADETLVRGPGWLRVTTPVQDAREGVLGRVSISIDSALVDRKARAARATALRMAAVLLGLAVVLSTIVITLVFRPLRALREGLRRIGQGDLDTPFDVQGPTEIALLGETLNDMTSDLKAAQALATAREQEMVATQRELIFTLGEIVEARSEETANHTRRVGAMSAELALLAGLSAEQADVLRMAAPMHDVGKIGIADEILCKEGPLTPEQRLVMQSHTEIGYRLFASSDRPILRAAATIARQHHERWDGRGYPHGLLREDIHVFGRIVAIIDVYDALSTDRVYRDAMPLDEVVEHLQQERGRQFDPVLVNLFLENLDRFRDIAARFPETRASSSPEPVGAGAG